MGRSGLVMVEVQDLEKRFGRHVAVDGVSFTIGEGEVFGLLGPNGAGKTTLLRILATLVRPDGGRVRVAGFDVRREGAAVRGLLGYVPQLLSADGALTGRENLLIFAKLLRLPPAVREQRIDEVLHLLQLEEAADRLVREYSGGMVRRLEIGQAILHWPRLLLLDEPTVGLDPTARQGIWAALEELRQENGMTVVVSTHYLEEAEAHCGRVAVLNRGRLAALGTPAELKAGVAAGAGSLEEAFAALTASAHRSEPGGEYREIRCLRRRVQRFH